MMNDDNDGDDDDDDDAVDRVTSNQAKISNSRSPDGVDRNLNFKSDAFAEEKKNYAHSIYASIFKWVGEVLDFGLDGGVPPGPRDPNPCLE